MKVSSTIRFLDDEITVKTQTKLFMFSNPHSSVIPFLLNGNMTTQIGFRVHYSTADEAILQQWHDRLCSEVECGNYQQMYELVRANMPPIPDIDLVRFITGFKY